MEDYQQQWRQCRETIRRWLTENAKDKSKPEHVWDVWFKDITLGGYDPEQRMVTLVVPSTYVYEYIEQLFVKLMSWALSQTFGQGVRLQYRLARQEPTYADVAEYLRQHSAYDSRRDPYHIRIADARKRMDDCMHSMLGDRARWLTAYDRITEWLTDNKGRGLLCVGAPSTGKSFFCQSMLPAILGNGGRPIMSVDAMRLHDRIEELLRERICIIDDLGKDDRKYFGNTDNSFFELCNNAERNGNLLIITTNLSPNIIHPDHPDAAVYHDSIERRYGREVLDRLKVITSVAVFKGESMRA